MTGNANEQQDSVLNDDPNNADDIYSDGPNPGEYQDDEEYRDWPQEAQYPIGDSRGWFYLSTPSTLLTLLLFSSFHR